MKKIGRFLLALVLLSLLISFLPVCALYFEKDPSICTNAQAIAKLKYKKEELFGFVVFGDNHAGLILSDSVALKLINRINAEDRYNGQGVDQKLPIRFVMSTGDGTFRSRSWDYRMMNRLRSHLKWPVISARGNHDDDNNPTLTYFRQYVGQSQLSFSYGNSYFIVADDSHGDITDDQFLWLEGELKKSLSYKHCFVFAHKSPISSSFLTWYRPEVRSWSYRLMKLLEQYKVYAMFAGHEHMFHQQTYGGVRYIVTGGAGMIPTIPSSEGGFTNYVVVRVYGDYVDYEVRHVTPPIWEIPLFAAKDAWFKMKDVIF